MEIIDYFVKVLIIYYKDFFFWYCFGEENVYKVYVFIRKLVWNDYGYVGFDYLILVRYKVVLKWWKICFSIKGIW